VTPERRLFLLRAAPPILVGAVAVGTCLLIGVPWLVWRSF
jgi:hypothetical protein